MSPSIRRMLWTMFAAFALLIAASVGVTIYTVGLLQRQEKVLVSEHRPLLNSVSDMESSMAAMVAAVRGYLLTLDNSFVQQYDYSVRNYLKAEAQALDVVTDARDRQLIVEFGELFQRIRELTASEIDLARSGDTAGAKRLLIASTRVRSSAPDYVGVLTDRIASRQRNAVDRISDFRQRLLLVMLACCLALIAFGAWSTSWIETRMRDSIRRQVRRTEAMIAGMADGVLLVDAQGRTAFINPAGRRLLGSNEVGIPIYRHAEVYRLKDEHGRLLSPKELPTARALASGKPVTDVTLLIGREDGEVAVSMSATPLQDRDLTAGVVVTFRDVTERRALEEQMQVQAERAQILADAGAFFSSNIDPAWVSQAIAERVARVLGDWAAIVLRRPDSSELEVASLFHRDEGAIGVAWSHVHRLPMVVGEGLVGEVIASGYPSLTTNLRPAMAQMSDEQQPAAAALSSLLVLPLRARREVIGALLIAAESPEGAMTDDKLPLAELLAERASFAIENSRLYTEQVEARRKVEDLSRLKDEFLSIASHELRTPVTSIKGYTQLAKMLIHEGDLRTSEEYLDIAMDQIDRMSRLILELLDVSRIETGRLDIRREEIDWSEFVQEIVRRHHAAGSEQRIRIASIEADGKVIGDPDRLEQVLGNLLENAVKYSPDGADVEVAVAEADGSILTTVSDRGIGIPADEIGQVFERFHRGRHVSAANYGGLGLGLYITRQIVERHGGQIQVESREGKGTTFSFTLPRANDNAARDEDRSAASV